MVNLPKSNLGRRAFVRFFGAMGKSPNSKRLALDILIAGVVWFPILVVIMFLGGASPETVVRVVPYVAIALAVGTAWLLGRLRKQ